jgi:hypothetical protein
MATREDSGDRSSPDYEHVWVFNGEGSHLPSGVFNDLDAALVWIKQHRLTGLLTAYPLNRGVYDWIVETGRWAPKEPHQFTPRFIGRFSSAYLEHHHFQDGEQQDA